MKFAVIDTETTGLDPATSAVLEVAILHLDDEGSEPELWHTYVKPTAAELAQAQPKALEVNGYAANPSLWDDAPTFDEVLNELQGRLRRRVPVGHNVHFDLAMLRANAARRHRKFYVSTRAVDTVQLAMEHLEPLGLTRFSLDAVRRFLGWHSIGAHTALVDVRQTADLLRLLWRCTGRDQLAIYTARQDGQPAVPPEHLLR